MERENSQKELGSPAEIGSVNGTYGLQGNGVFAEMPSENPSENPDTSGAEAPDNKGEESRDSEEHEDTDSSDVLNRSLPSQSGETLIRQRPGPWMSL